MSDDQEQRIANPPSTTSASAFLGLGVLASAFGIAILFVDSPNLGFKAGAAFGQLLGSAAFALPIFLVWRFATKRGRAARLSWAFNVFCFALVLLWLLLFVIAKNALPTLAAGYEAGHSVGKESARPSRGNLPICEGPFDHLIEPPRCRPN